MLLVHRTHSTAHFGARFSLELLRFCTFYPSPFFVIIRIEPVIPAKDEVREVESIPISRHSRLRGNPGQKTIPNRIMLSVFHDAQTVFVANSLTSKCHTRHFSSRNLILEWQEINRKIISSKKASC